MRQGQRERKRPRRAGVDAERRDRKKYRQRKRENSKLDHSQCSSWCLKGSGRGSLLCAQIWQWKSSSPSIFHPSSSHTYILECILHVIYRRTRFLMANGFLGSELDALRLPFGGTNQRAKAHNLWSWPDAHRLCYYVKFRHKKHIVKLWKRSVTFG